MKKYVVINTQVEGFHRWEGAPQDVAFLRDLHRHMFHIQMKMSVSGSNREVEIIKLKRFITQKAEWMLSDPVVNKDKNMSCEMMAEYLIKVTAGVFGTNRKYECSVLEDGENGAVVCSE